MKNLILLFLGFIVAYSSLAKTVSQDEAQIVADNYFSHYSGRVDAAIMESFSIQYNGITVYYVFNYAGGGFVVIAADDAVVPVQAESNEGLIEQVITNPNSKFWFDSYSKEIGHIIAAKYDNSATLKQWSRIRYNDFDKSSNDVGPLLATNWDQGDWYNYYCPAESSGPGGHVWAGCVATAMCQVMKYYNFPAKGVLSNSYMSQTYGLQSAYFGDSTYHWELMGNSANSSNYASIATLLYHAGVAVEMNYNLTGSGTPAENIPWDFPRISIMILQLLKWPINLTMKFLPGKNY
jgi:hypothetical protein